MEIDQLAFAVLNVAELMYVARERSAALQTESSQALDPDLTLQ